MNILQINACTNESTGAIMMDIRDRLQKSGEKIMTSSRFDFSKRKITYPDHVYIGSLMDKYMHRLFATFSGNEGGFSKIATKRFLKQVNIFQPDIIHMHNLHANYINLEILFDYLKEHNDIKVIWTLHDCWAFTGHCPHFDSIGCDKWKIQCEKCCLYKNYPKSFFDNSTNMYKKKKALFTGIEKLTIVTPSRWLSEQVKESFLKEYPIHIINNGINIDIFKKYFNSGEIRSKYHIIKKYMILGVASNWSVQKGVDTMVRLAECLPENMQVVLVGRLGKAIISDKIIAIERTENKMQLAQIYSAADVFVNPTVEDNYPTVNMEAIACGTPVITYATGGSPEILNRECGLVIDKGDFSGLVNAICASINRRWDEKSFEELRDYFSCGRMIDEYLALYYSDDK